MVAFDFERLFDEGTMYMITPTEAGQNFNDLDGLLDVNFTDNTVTAGTLVSTLVLDYGTALNPIQFLGAVGGDFAILVNGVAGTITGASESPAGTYTITFSGTTAGDDIVISVDKAGYDGETSFTAA